MKRNKVTVLAVLVLVSFILSSCTFSFKGIVTGSGIMAAEERDVSGFTAIELNGVGRLYIIQGGTESLKIEAENNILPELSSDVAAGTLTLGYVDNFWRKSVIPTEQIVYTLTVVDLTEITINGAGDVDVEELETNSLDLIVNGAGKIEIDDLTSDELSVHINGTATIELGGEVSEQTVDINGTGNYQAADMQSSSAQIKIQGLGNARVWVVDVLTLTINGGGSVSYYGSPELSQEVNGFSDITHLGDK
jgi:hypothetical protein